VADAKKYSASVESAQVRLTGVGKSQDCIHDADVAFAKGGRKRVGKAPDMDRGVDGSQKGSDGRKPVFGEMRDHRCGAFQKGVGDPNYLLPLPKGDTHQGALCGGTFGMSC
jgi:hypothetical protein